jgi:hypothetical protein
LNNGDLKQVNGFTKDGDIKLANGWVMGKDYGNLTHGYYVTSYASQSKSVDRVFVAESSESFRAADRQQFYVSVSRFKESLTIYTDDKEHLREAVAKSSERPLATDLAKQRLSETPNQAVAEREPVQEAPAPGIGAVSKNAEIAEPQKVSFQTRPMKRIPDKTSTSRGVSL